MLDVTIIGQRIKARREDLGLTLDDVAMRTGITKATLSRYENGVFSRLKVPILESIARALEIEPEQLFDSDTALPSYERPTITKEQLLDYLDTLSDAQLLDLLQMLTAKLAERRAKEGRI